LIADAEIPNVYSILQTIKNCGVGATWNRRYREYMEKIKTGSIYELAEVLRDLCLLKVDKDLSFGERKMLDTARNLLVREISIAQGVSEDKVEQDIFQILTH